MKKEVIHNDRFPHWATITRLVVPDNPFEKEADEDEIVDDETGVDTTFSDEDTEEDTEDVQDTSEEENASEGDTEEEDEVIILYDGPCRAFTDTTTTGSSLMDSNKRKCSLPVPFGMWAMEILDGDSIDVKVGDIEYKGVVKDFEPDNDRTLIYWERPRVND